MSVRGKLHDEKDALEAIQERWRQAITSIRVEMGFIAKHSTDWRDVFSAVNLISAQRLGELTTEAAELGAKSKL